MWKRIANPTALAAVLTVTIAACSGGGPTPTPTVDGPAALRMLERSLFGGRAEVLLRELPEGFAVPLPGEFEVVGSMVRPDGAATVYLVAEGDRETIFGAHRAMLTEGNWVEIEQNSRFGPVEPYPAQYCSEQRDVSFTVIAWDPEEGSTEIDLTLLVHDDQTTRTTCDPDPRFASDSAPNILPFMEPPDGLTQRGSSGGGGSGNVERSFQLEGSMDIAEVDDHYSRALKDAGWQRLGFTTAEGIVLSAWRLTDRLGDQWSATLLVAREEDGSEFTQVAIQAVILVEP